MNITPLRRILLAISLVLIVSCGGGGRGAGGSGAIGTSGSTDAGSIYQLSSTSFARDSAGASDSAGSTGGNAGANADAGSTSTASSDSGSGVGSGGTGVSADASGVGSVGGLGSVFLNSLRYNTDAATFDIQDAPALEAGMSVKITGSVNATFTAGSAAKVESAAELNGPVTAIDAGAGTFRVMGTSVTTSSATVWADAAGLAAIPRDATLQVWGLPSAPGVLLATRVEQRPAYSPIVTGTVQNLNTAARSFKLGGLSVYYSAATFVDGFDPSLLRNGDIVRVRAARPPAGSWLSAISVQRWYPLPTFSGTAVRTAGEVTGFISLNSLRVLGTQVDGSAANISGGPSKAIADGVKIEVDGFLQGGVIIASNVRITHIPGNSDASSFVFIGSIGAFTSSADFKVKGQSVDASGGAVTFVNGTAANLRSGAKVTVSGQQLLSGRLIASRVEFD